MFTSNDLILKQAIRSRYATTLCHTKCTKHPILTRQVLELHFPQLNTHYKKVPICVFLLRSEEGFLFRSLLLLKQSGSVRGQKGKGFVNVSAAAVMEFRSNSYMHTANTFVQWGFHLKIKLAFGQSFKSSGCMLQLRKCIWSGLKLVAKVIFAQQADTTSNVLRRRLPLFSDNSCGISIDEKIDKTSTANLQKSVSDPFHASGSCFIQSTALQ